MARKKAEDVVIDELPSIEETQEQPTVEETAVVEEVAQEPTVEVVEEKNEPQVIPLSAKNKCRQ